MKNGRRRGHGAGLAGEDGLVALAVRCAGVAPANVARQRNFAKATHRSTKSSLLVVP